MSTIAEKYLKAFPAIWRSKYLMRRRWLQFVGLMVEHDVGVRTSRTISNHRMDEDFFAE
ncbi:hypothetical protein [Pseudovibrio axinellae]|uniref:hypothetical protein n=1 Tax=Pseudovibrio axinellae TaxID=989403 RepID=UPI00158795E9|nr:hypothetical protein [Pseudovibrio axinellae]